jgi:hypothetical protein
MLLATAVVKCNGCRGPPEKRVALTLGGCDLFEVALALRVRIAAKPKVLRAFRLAERDGYNRVRKKSQALRVRRPSHAEREGCNG